MTTALHSGVLISVSSHYESRFSNPDANLFMFTYRIEITNRNTFPIQLKRRHWFIVDSTTERREVEGEGVVGQQPVLYPGESYHYRSSCDFTSDTGQMKGFYQMENLESGEHFDAEIPAFMLMAPHRLN